MVRARSQRAQSLMPHASALVTVMINAARKAARGLRRDFGEVEALQVSRKGAADFVSAADLRAEQVLFEELARARPKYGFVMEEKGEIEGADNSNRWVVDPLDGTTNFLHGLAHFAISIALERDRQPYAGVIYNPATDELYWAEKGEGAWLNDRRLRVSARGALDEALFATGLPFKGRPGRAEALAEVDRVLEKTAGVRRFGSAALDLAFVAAGRYDAYWERGLNNWDVAAGVVLVREAGGIVTEIDGGPRPALAGSILAANAEIYDKAKALIAGA
ncbi:myo-inositol-1(or 4)-monophosphatase [Amphiplicatus metriothermophilus]|uniref:Inositol-1-monophosphatase n=2 Tax=Amphiplicatus metriothermophilus TaxID=1519374 RepID=A0A239PK81_9PROT|nr:myo-inositol-1(or 4)-monophosphatase [Amphiplicatus metriothermophilus]